MAVSLDSATRASLAEAAGELRRHARQLPVAWVSPENFHVTVKFLGGVDDTRLHTVIDALHTAARGHSPFAIEVGGLGAFPSRTRPRVLWAGVLDGADPLETLAGSVDEALAAVGFPRESRAFSPHITLGRVREPAPAPALAEALGAGAERRFGRVEVTQLALMRSDLSPHGACYSLLASAALSPGGAG